jgi:hypothetical protein
MAHDYSEIQNAFLDGTLEIFTELFTDKVQLYLLDTEKTVVDPLYEETSKKCYKEPIDVVAQVILSRQQGDKTPEAILTNAAVKLPAKVLIDLNIPFESKEDLKVLEQSRIKYKGTTLQVNVAEPSTLVGDTFIFVTLSCTMVKQRG